MDAVDTALINVDENTIELIDFLEYPIPIRRRVQLRNINGNTPLQEVIIMDVWVGELFAEAAISLIDRTGIATTEITAIGSHGQTILHSPNSLPPYTVQIGDPNVIASRTGITTVADFRRMDIVNGGQGAPLTPLFHKACFQAEYPQVILNIGGVANITLLTNHPDDPIIGYDTGPGNCLMDDWVNHHQSQPFDNNGEWADSGKVNDHLLQKLLDDKYFKLKSPKSTGRDEFNLTWLQQHLSQTTEDYAPRDVQRTLLALTVESIAKTISDTRLKPREVLVCGGGAKNKLMMQQLASAVSPATVKTTNDYGMDGNAVEASCFAWLANARMTNIPLKLKSLTGCQRESPLGCLYLS